VQPAEIRVRWKISRKKREEVSEEEERTRGHLFLSLFLALLPLPPFIPLLIYLGAASDGGGGADMARIRAGPKRRGRGLGRNDRGKVKGEKRVCALLTLH
jgi:hypothetical protein